MLADWNSGARPALPTSLRSSTLAEGANSLRDVIRSCMPARVRERVPPRVKARLRAWLGFEPWPDLAVRHPLFRSADYRRLRESARVFDVPRPDKPVLERPHQTSFVLARWLADAGVRRAFHVGYANARHVFYLSAMGIECGGTDLPEEQTPWVRIAEGALDASTRRRLLRKDFFQLTSRDFDQLWPERSKKPMCVLFSEATFETLLPWRETGMSVPAYGALSRGELRSLMHERFPAKLAELEDRVDDMLFIEPEPAAGGAGAVFEACARRLSALSHSVWGFRPPLDRVFRLSPHHPCRQVVYAFTRDQRLLDGLRAYADPL
jgi:hypothetical protein